MKWTFYITFLNLLLATSLACSVSRSGNDEGVISGSVDATADTIALTLEGTYMGKNVYVQNPYTDDGSWCATGVVVNDALVLDSADLHQNAFEIGLDLLGFNYGDAVIIEIYHKRGCMPHVLQVNTCIITNGTPEDTLRKDGR